MVYMSNHSDAKSAAEGFHAFTRSLWTEFKIAADYSTGMSEVTRATSTPPRGFVQNELGFSSESPDKCSPGCHCNALRPSRFAGDKRRRRRTGRDWQDLVSRATEAAQQAA